MNIAHVKISKKRWIKIALAVIFLVSVLYWRVQFAEFIVIIGDRDAFKQVMMILLDNALKHSSGEVEVKTQQAYSSVEIRVRDHGEGISPKVLPHVFDRFYRAEDHPTIPGFGLGLPIAKALVEDMGGEISVESKLGKGSEVRLSFQST